jgi:hypothetical protein
MTLLEFANSVDYKLLQEQKITLIDVNTIPSLMPDKVAALDGIINFIDAFQDAIVESNLKTEEDVFSI